ncbi:glycosyltransferase family 2 protein [Actinomyces sp. MRS3W]|uniref:glycosyltransferase family 2 protein n=1 Tax=Actinomyces sp. MRS3W TaxID=2800796 RepID=UPI0028FD8075|nr:glycosyltransferase family 2 protein [Actinomyces sp. MRS3W]MDU0349604.1 glycosyltransferase family 2 protein [Actinomyces sp. MRS3W]
MTRTSPSLPRANGDGPLISVIVPAYNSERHIAQTLHSVQSQTVTDLEILVVDDASSDRTLTIAEQAAAQDPRIHVFAQPVNAGVARARNRALAHARGRYIAYLDSDDQWLPHKLERQLAFMSARGVGACITSYETIEENGAHRNYVRIPASIDYRGFLKNTLTCTLTILLDTTIVDPALLVMPDLRRGQDAATWLQVMKRGHRLYGLDECLAKYRKTAGSLSSNKIKAVKRTWNLYRNVEGMSRPYAAYCLSWQLFHAALKRRKDA